MLLARGMDQNPENAFVAIWGNLVAESAIRLEYPWLLPRVAIVRRITLGTFVCHLISSMSADVLQHTADPCLDNGKELRVHSGVLRKLIQSPIELRWFDEFFDK